jgi:hypothetical protein
MLMRMDMEQDVDNDLAQNRISYYKKNVNRIHAAKDVLWECKASCIRFDEDSYQKGSI